MLEDIQSVLVSEEQLKTRIHELAAELSREYDGKDPIFLGILKGCMMFYSDMVRSIDILCRTDFMVVSSYGAGTDTSGTVRILKDTSYDLKDQHVVILEDIIDSGFTLSKVCEILKDRGAASVKVCTMLDKPSRRKVDFTADYTGFTIPNEFAVGFGLDYNEHYRNLPFVGVLKPEVYTK